MCRLQHWFLFVQLREIDRELEPMNYGSETKDASKTEAEVCSPGDHWVIDGSYPFQKCSLVIVYIFAYRLH